MASRREVVSMVRSTSKLISGDNSINSRTIDSEMRSVSRVFIRQYLNKRLLWSTDSIFTTIPCLEMVDVPIAECCSYSSDKRVSRSKYKLPRIADSNFDYVIQGVYALDLNKTIYATSINSYIAILKLKLPSSKIFYWIHDGYLYCSSEYVKRLKLVAFLDEDLSPEIEFSDCECENGVRENECINPLDKPFNCPEFLINGVVKEVRNTLLQTYFKIPVDHTSDNKDDQVNKS